MLTTITVNASAMLLESVPFVVAGALCARLLARSSHFVAYLGCGCGSGPSARSLPAAFATWFVFGPWIALARIVAATILDMVTRRKRRTCMHANRQLSLNLHELVMPSVTAAACAPLLPAILGMHASPEMLFAISAITAFVAAPCGLGSIGIAAAFRSLAPAAAAGFLCVAGLLDWRVWRASDASHDSHDFLAYCGAALTCALVAARGGGGLVNPKIAIALWPCTLVLALLAGKHRNANCARFRLAPVIMLAGSVLGAPPPTYHATETTLSDAFAGEHVDFTGALSHDGSAVTLARYAITCCRADAAPVSVRLDNAPAALHTGWFHASGTLIARGESLRLKVDRLESVRAPADPFIYR